MTKSRHHYVPRFYLRDFASKPRRINILNLRTGNFHRDGSLRDQCFRPKFYGDSDEIENQLMNIESIVIRSLSRIKTRHILPEALSADHKEILIFVALQILRTSVAAESMAEGMNKMVDLLAPRDRTINQNEPQYIVDAKETVLLSIENYLLVARCLDDLGMLLIVNKTEVGFVTSDNPVVQYNQYLEGLKMGTTGALRRGLQLFLPLSPELMILLYDKVVYKAGNKHSSLLELTNVKDLVTLNLLQIVNAEKVVLFSNWNDIPAIEEITRSSRRYRKSDLAKVEEFVSEHNQHDSLLKIYPVPLDIKLSLSFMRLRRRVQPIKKTRRALEFRKDIRPEGDAPVQGQAQPIRYVRREADE